MRVAQAACQSKRIGDLVVELHICSISLGGETEAAIGSRCAGEVGLRVKHEAVVLEIVTPKYIVQTACLTCQLQFLAELLVTGIAGGKPQRRRGSVEI